ncbi:MAG: hypothetical protein WDM87_10740 [Terracidiphilus sp.]
MVQYGSLHSQRARRGRRHRPPVARTANVGRNSLFGPGFKDLDLGVFRNITFEHGVVFQLRGESTNALNWVNLANPTGSLASGNYGKITSATGTQRLIQVGGRLTF